MSMVACGGSTPAVKPSVIHVTLTPVTASSPRIGDAEATTSESARLLGLSAGYFHTCGVREDRTVVCWGDNPMRQPAPAGRFQSVSAGDMHACGVREDGTVACWGEGRAGQSTPPAGRFQSVSAGYFHTCGVREDGTVACWGEDEKGQSTPPEGLILRR